MHVVANAIYPMLEWLILYLVNASQLYTMTQYLEL